jgi:hypothetical protein
VYHRALKDEKTARLGISECLKHDLVEPYPVLYEKAGTKSPPVLCSSFTGPSFL